MSNILHSSIVYCITVQLSLCMPALRKWFVAVALTFAVLCFAQEGKTVLTPNSELIPNHGQWHPAVRYKMPVPYGNIYMRSDGMTYDLMSPDDYTKIQEFRHQNPAQSADHLLLRKHAISIHFQNMRYVPRIAEFGHKEYYYNYFNGNDPSKYTSKVTPCTKLVYRNVYPFIDFEVLTAQELKYQWVIREPKLADIEQISIKIEGADSIKIIDSKLYIFTSVGTIIEDAPVCFQYDAETSTTYDVQCEFMLDNNLLGYKFMSEINPNLALTIDPKLIFSTYSGSYGDNFGYTATYDSRGNLYAGGIVDNADGEYPVTTGAYDTTWNGGAGNSPVLLPCDVSISKYDSAGTQLLWATYLGGFRDEYPHSLVVDRNDDLIIYGTTYSNNHPTTKTAYDTTHNGGTDIFVSKISSDGSLLLASTFIGGTKNDGLVQANSSLQHNYADNFRGDVIPDDDLHVFVASSTNSSNMPLALEQKAQIGGSQDAYIFELNEDFSQLLWATYLGGDGIDAAYSIKIDQNNNICIGGGTTSNNMPSTDTAYQSTISGSVDGYIGVFTKAKKKLKYLSYYGTPSYDQIYFIDIDNKGNIYATGQTEGSISQSSGTYGSSNKGQFIFKIDTGLQNIEWQTTFGNTNNKINLAPSAFLVDVCEHIYFSGWGSDISPSLAHPGSTKDMVTTSNAEQKTTDSNDFYIIVLDKDASGLLYATFFGGDSTADHVDGGTSRFDKRGVIYQSVCSSCPGYNSKSKLQSEISDFPVTSNAAFTHNNSVRCSNASFKIDLQIKSAVVADFLASPSLGCAPLDVIFTNKSVLGDEWLWEFGDGQTSTAINPTHTYSEPGLYEVTLTVIDSNTCNISDVYKRTILVIEKGTADFKAEYLQCSDELHLTNNSIDAYAYLWDFGNGETSTEKEPNYYYKENGTYKIKLVVNPDSYCADSAFVTVTIDRLGDQNFTLYNAFSPNNDNINDCFKFDGLEQFCEGIEWQVYNRWGELVFETINPTACWNGNLFNTTIPLPESVYFYILNLNPGSVNSQNLISGTITLFR